ncbi:flagellin FliC3 [Butyrivibrio proteoclasticus B316]|uniref:Flagellin n=1 Tax=Butyrivibrio proteoclasticus (strain ATCC 51982 / DSM 14932 / B316) TaxID=515622 RepID=E0RUC4_BUTPB|nr:flagellin [Butyrivibrio proteoclasticus]ADL32814.1 flagellin FliC3 [Butyrivibrio proteoclasticus B316]
MKINYNVSAMIANNALQRNDTLLSESLERLSSGLKIANAKDNPSGLAMSRRMNSQIEGLGVAGDTSNDGISIVQVADGSLSEIQEILQRMNQLAVQASNGTLTNSDREAIQEEASLLKEEIERMAQTTQFNGQSILDGTFDLKGYATIGDTFAGSQTDASVKVVNYSDVVEAGVYKITGIDVSYLHLTGTTGVDKQGIFFENDSDKAIKIERVNDDGTTTSYMNNGMIASVNEDVLTLRDSTGKKIDIQIDRSLSDTLFVDLTASGAMTMQVGANEGQTLDIRIPKVNLTTLGIYNLDMANPEGALEAIEEVKGALANISSIRSRLGSYQNRLEHTSSSLDITVENMTAAYSRIMDVDMAEEMTVYSTQQVLSQAGISMMAQANERPSQVLQLLQ